MDAAPIAAWLVGGSLRLVEEMAGEATDQEWVSAPAPGGNLIGFTVWHCARTVDWGINRVVRGRGEMAERPEWRDVARERALFGAGAPKTEADAVARSVGRERVLEYVRALGVDIEGWQATADLDRTSDVRAGARPEYLVGECWAEIEDLHGIPLWQFVVRPCVSHIRIHYGEVSAQLEAIRSGAS